MASSSSTAPATTLKAITGQVCLVTGGCSGLGLGAARYLHERGARVALLDLPETADTARRLIRDHFTDTTALYTPADVSVEEEVQAAVSRVTTHFGRIDVVVNNAGVNYAHHAVCDVTTSTPYPMERMRRMIDINLIGAINVIRLTTVVLARNEPDSDGVRGVIINTGSISGMDAVTHQLPYVCSKAAVNEMTLPLAYELAEHGIRVCTIAPGSFESNAINKLPPDTLKGHCLSNFFPARKGKAEEFGHLVGSIIENPMFNGATIRLDGATRIFWVAK